LGEKEKNHIGEVMRERVNCGASLRALLLFFRLLLRALCMREEISCKGDIETRTYILLFKFQLYILPSTM
jgi:hypothetical protein